MSEQVARMAKVELRVIITYGKTDVYFWHGGQKYRTIYLDGGCDNVVIGEWEESVCAWARLEVVDSEKDQKPFKIELQTNVTTLTNRAMLEHLVSKANVAISDGYDMIIDMTDALQSLAGWDVHFSNIPTPK